MKGETVIVILSSLMTLTENEMVSDSSLFAASLSASGADTGGSEDDDMVVNGVLQRGELLWWGKSVVSQMVQQCSEDQSCEGNQVALVRKLSRMERMFDVVELKVNMGIITAQDYY